MTATTDEHGPNVELAALAETYFHLILASEPIYASMLGKTEYDELLPDPSRAAAGRRDESLRKVESSLLELDVATLNRTDRITRSIMLNRIRNERGEIANDLSDVTISGSVFGEFSQILSTVPQVSLTDSGRAEAYLLRLAAMGAYFDAMNERHREAKAEGRYPSQLGVEQAIAQIDGYLAADVPSDPFLTPALPAGVDAEKWRARATAIITEVVRPALLRRRSVLADELLPVGRDDDHVGMCHVPGGADGYAAIVRFYITTGLPPADIHHLGLTLLAELRAEIGEAGKSAMDTGDVVEVLRRLREDPALRFDSAESILEYVNDAYRRAEQSMTGWFRPYSVPECAIREMDQHQARGGIAAYYHRPSIDGTRPGTCWVNTYLPAERPMAGYEVLAFHEALPGHHLQAAVGAEGDLPDFRRYRRSVAHAEGWGLYVERLADDMGLYSSETARLGMLSSAAWRACRLVVDTGMHHLGWSRAEAIEFMRDNTALSDLEITNEVDRYIAAPGQALSYMIGQIRITELRDRAKQELGPAFDIADFHHRVLAEGSMPLDSLEELINDWVAEAR